MNTAAAAGKPIYYSFKSPLIGLHATGNQKLQDESISKLSYRPQPCQKDLAVHVDQSTVAKNLKFDCYCNPPKSVTQEAFSVPSNEKQAPINYGLKDSLLKTPHEMAQDYRYVSNIRSMPDRNESMNTKFSTNQVSYTPIPLTDRQLHHIDIYRNASIGNQVPDSNNNMQSEYKKSFMREIVPVNRKEVRKPSLGTVMSHYCPRGGSKLNISHNIITGDRFDKHERKIGTTVQNEDFCAWAMSRPKPPTHNPAVLIHVTSIKHGDRDKVSDSLSSTHAAFQDPCTGHTSSAEALRFNTSETAGKTFKSSVRHHSDARAFTRDAYTSTSKMDYTKHEAERSSLAGSAFTRGVSSFPKGDLDPTRVQERLNGDTTKCLHVKHSPAVQQSRVNMGELITHSNVKLGSSKEAPLCDVTSNQQTFAPYSGVSKEHLISPPKDLLTLKLPPEYVPSSHVAAPKSKHLSQVGLSNRIKHALDYTSHWTLNSSGKPYYLTTHKDDFSADVLAKSIV